MIDRDRRLPEEIPDLFVGLDAFVNSSRLRIAFMDGRIHDAARHLKPATIVLGSSGSPRKFGSISGAAKGSGAGEFHAAARNRAQQADMARIAVAEVTLTGMIVDEADDEMQPDVRDLEIGARLQEAAGLREIGRHGDPVRSARYRLMSPSSLAIPHGIAQRVERIRLVAEGEVRMILQVEPTPGR